MRNVFITMSLAAMFVAMTACTSTDKQNKAMLDEPFRQDKEFMDKLEAIVRDKVKNMGNEETTATDDDFDISDFDEEL